jgi:branched-chain amino acid aminotransferase
MPKHTFYLDGRYIRMESSMLDLFTPGRFTAYGVFETLRVEGHEAIFLEEHLDRLQQGLRILKIKCPHNASALKRIIKQVLLKNASITRARLRIMVFRLSATVHCCVMAIPYVPPSPAVYRRGLRAVFVKTARPASAKLSSVKSLDYGLLAGALDEARRQGHDEALLLNGRGHVFEASRANVFIFKAGELFTPPLSSGCLQGITRAKVIAQARAMGIAVVEQNITPANVRGATHIFLTNSLWGILPVTVA